MLRVVTRVEPPYVMKCTNCTNSEYQGFAIDLLDAISEVNETGPVNITLHFTLRLLASNIPYTLFLIICMEYMIMRLKNGME